MRKYIAVCSALLLTISCDFSPNRETVTNETFQKVLAKETGTMFMESSYQDDAQIMKKYFIEVASQLNTLIHKKTNGNIGGSQSYSFFLKEDIEYNIVTIYKRDECTIVIKRTAFNDDEKYYLTSYFLHVDNLIIDVIRMDNKKNISFERIGDVNHLKISLNDALGFTL